VATHLGQAGGNYREVASALKYLRYVHNVDHKTQPPDRTSETASSEIAISSPNRCRIFHRTVQMLCIDLKTGMRTG